MAEYIFKSILITSFVGTILTLFITLIKPLTKKVFSASWHYYIWLMVLIVMILPVRFSFPQSTPVIPPLEINSGNPEVITVEEENEAIQLNDFHKEQQSEEATSYQGVTQKIFRSNMHILSLIWIIGGCLLFLLKISGYFLFVMKIKRNSVVISCPETQKFTKRKITTRKGNNIVSPLIIGLFRPTLVLPDVQMSSEQLENVLSHEMTHLKRYDILYKWFTNLVKCIHWFNPAVYYITKQIDTECEISCDIEAVKNMNNQEELSYIDTILYLLNKSNSKTINFTTGMTGDKKTLKKRFLTIKNKVKISKKALVISVILSLLILGGAIFASGYFNGKILNNTGSETLSLSTDKAENQNFNFLILGLDANKNPDTIVVLSHRDGNTNLLSIPRDTALFDNKNNTKKAISLLKEENGDQKVIDAVKNTLSIPINYYAKINLDAIGDIADLFGDIDMYIPMDMSYDDPDQNLKIRLKKGYHTLNAEGIRGLLQYRRSNTGEGYKDGDLSRIRMAQSFIGEFIKQKLTPESIDKLPEFYNIMSKNISTNYTSEDLENHINVIKNISENGISSSILDGKPSLKDDGTIVYEINFSSAENTLKSFGFTKNEPVLKETKEEIKSQAGKTNSNAGADNKKQPVLVKGFSFVKPAEGEISNSFGKREHPITKEVTYHNGIDIKAEKGSKVISSMAGTVVETGFDAEKGNYIIIENEGIKTLYSALEEISVNVNDSVDKNQEIGKVGSTGKAAGAHLHFEVSVNNEFKNPEEFFN